jgi:hypothetical protein
MQLKTPDGRQFNFFIELDNGTEPVTSPKQRESLERKIRFYERLQDTVLAKWKRSLRRDARPRYRVLFFVRSVDREKHLLWTARQLARNPDRRLCLGISLGEFLASPNPLRAPIAVDHHGHWTAIVSEAYEARFCRDPINLRVAAPLAGCAT